VRADRRGVHRRPAIPTGIGHRAGRAGVARLAGGAIEGYRVGQRAAEPGRQTDVMHRARNSVEEHRNSKEEEAMRTSRRTPDRC
jgi:hypothetical protein